MSDAIYYSIIGMLGIGFTLAILKYWNRKLTKKYKMEENNLSFGIFVSAQIIGFGILFTSAVEPLLVLKTTLEISSKSTAFLEIAKYLGLFLSLILVFFVIVISVAVIGYKVFTGSQFGFLETVKGDNKSAALIVAALIISSSYIIAGILQKVLMDVLPHPSFF